ncbi:hypothetical protein GQ55_1G113400 [Panicum hallii var. hallii]|uniref:Uncharacterized protein n=1 Tax=Panicum hallii var. hallii TaxID=1504633 RepID=A0A2T7F4K0_9POAL|nr:hypothetical protein GQ55_1G113400 [Panicum hallii var. hallii]
MLVEPSRRNAARARAARETQPSQPPRPRREPSGNPSPTVSPFFHLLPDAPPPFPHKCRASGRAGGLALRKEQHAGNLKALERRKRRERGGQRRPGTRGSHRPPVADAIRTRGFFKLWWWLVCLIRALLLFSARRTVSQP